MTKAKIYLTTVNPYNYDNNNKFIRAAVNHRIYLYDAIDSSVTSTNGGYELNIILPQEESIDIFGSNISLIIESNGDFNIFPNALLTQVRKTAIMQEDGLNATIGIVVTFEVRGIGGKPYALRTPSNTLDFVTELKNLLNRFETYNITIRGSVDNTTISKIFTNPAPNE